MKIRWVAPALAAFFLYAPFSWAGHIHKEREYQNAWCAEVGGETEVVLDDGTRVDCLTDEYAVEVDFAPKWAEAVGQSLYYAEKTGRRPGVLLILEKNTDERYLRRLQTLADRYQIDVWETRPQKMIGGEKTRGEPLYQEGKRNGR